MLRGNKATASDFTTMFLIMITDSQAIEGKAFMPERDGFSPVADSLTNCRNNAGGNREILTNG